MRIPARHARTCSGHPRNTGTMHGDGRVKPGYDDVRKMSGRLLDRDEERVADLAVDVIGQMALAVRVFDQDYLARVDDAALAVAGGELHPGVEVDDVLPARRRVPAEIMLGLGLAKDHAGRRHFLRQFAAAPLLGPIDLDVAEMRLAVGVGVEVVDLHLASPYSAALAAGSSA